MMAFIFIILLLAVLFVWLGNRKAAFNCYILSLIFSIFWFLHHVTSELSLQL